VYRYRKAFFYLLRTLLLMLSFYLLLEFGLELLQSAQASPLDSRLKPFAFLIGLNVILALSLPAVIKEFQRIRAEQQMR
jgi:hypothetical protein